MKGKKVLARCRALAPLALLLTALLAHRAGGGLAAWEVAAADWQPAELTGPVVKLFVPATGALFAQTSDGLLRSDDAARSWTTVPLPPPAADPDSRWTRLVVDPTDDRVAYAVGPEGLYRTQDAGATWAPVFRATETLTTVAVSSADPQVVYVALRRSPTAFPLWRSQDGAATWEDLEVLRGACGPIGLIEPHPTDPDRAFRTAGCYISTQFGDKLQQTTDRGATWSELSHSVDGYPVRVVGGGGVAPGRFYFAANRDDSRSAGGSRLLRSDDDAVTWTEVLEYRGGGRQSSPTGPAAVRIGGLAYDPLGPDRVYVGLSSGLVRTSPDGGLTWSDLGGTDLGPIRDLALDPDRLNLYAATDRGLWRLSLHPEANQ